MVYPIWLILCNDHNIDESQLRHNTPCPPTVCFLYSFLNYYHTFNSHHETIMTQGKKCSAWTNYQASSSVS